MRYAIYNPTTNTIQTWLIAPKGTLPEGYEFRDEADVPSDAQVAAPVPVIPVPQEVERWALKEVCAERGHEVQIQTAFSKLPPDMARKAKGRWADKVTISRGSDMIKAMQAILKWSDAYVNELFIESDKLTKS